QILLKGSEWERPACPENGRRCGPFPLSAAEHPRGGAGLRRILAGVKSPSGRPNAPEHTPMRKPELFPAQDLGPRGIGAPTYLRRIPEKPFGNRLPPPGESSGAPSALRKRHGRVPEWQSRNAEPVGATPPGSPPFHRA